MFNEKIQREQDADRAAATALQAEQRAREAAIHECIVALGLDPTVLAHQLLAEKAFTVGEATAAARAKLADSERSKRAWENRPVHVRGNDAVFALCGVSSRERGVRVHNRLGDAQPTCPECLRRKVKQLEAELTKRPAPTSANAFTAAFVPLPESTCFPKKCGCCGTSYTAEQWSRLPLKGQLHGLEFRNCSHPKCDSTLAVSVDAKAA